ncbi:MAG TPA: GNAT family N-acetyltransferase [Solirubrobacteraceae bacterium]|jgi:GNAT superfamily N-acetyltransferase
MSSPVSIEPRASRAQAQTPAWRVRGATPADAAALAAAARALLSELGASPPATPAVEAAALALLQEPASATVLVAQAGTEIVGLLGASWQSALHIPGRYCLIQDLWVDARWRGQAIGSELLEALLDLAQERQVACIEVGLPRARFAGLHKTEAFYLEHSFTALGTRMRRTLP